ncbi:MAG: sel1 repeat family protein [Sphingomonadales bacterium]|nr:sel1 repeat family protein [Sphingomonadales bacterium]MBD3772042.1 sel1 repeat family protein [Paracoccaceae bacterium]
MDLETQGKLSPGDIKKFHDAFDYACQSGNGVVEGCYFLGKVYYDGRMKVSPKDRELYVNRSWRVACNAFDGEACYGMGDIAEHSLIAKQPANALRYYGMACERNFARGCDKVIDLAWGTAGKPPSYQKDARAYARAVSFQCIYGDKAACGVAKGVWAEQGLDGGKGALAGRAYLAGCRMGDAGACYNAAAFHSWGSPYVIGHDFNIANALLGRTCAMKVPAACKLLDTQKAKGNVGDGNIIDPMLPEGERFAAAMDAIDSGDIRRQRAGIAALQWMAATDYPPGPGRTGDDCRQGDRHAVAAEHGPWRRARPGLRQCDPGRADDPRMRQPRICPEELAGQLLTGDRSNTAGALRRNVKIAADSRLRRAAHHAT